MIYENRYAGLLNRALITPIGPPNTAQLSSVLMLTVNMCPEMYSFKKDAISI
jgi:hypothetical protein